MVESIIKSTKLSLTKRLVFHGEKWTNMVNFFRQNRCLLTFLVLLNLPQEDVLVAVQSTNCHNIRDVSAKFVEIENRFEANFMKSIAINLLDTNIFTAHEQSSDSLLNIVMKYHEGQQLAMVAFLINDIQRIEERKISYTDQAPDFYIFIYAKLSSEHNWPYSYKTYTYILGPGGDAYASDGKKIVYTYKQAIGNILDAYKKLPANLKVCDDIFFALERRMSAIDDQK